MSSSQKLQKMQEQLNALNKQYGGGAKVAANPKSVDTMEPKTLESLLDQRVEYAQEFSLLTIGALKVDGHIPASIVFGTPAKDEQVVDLSRIICS